MDLGYYEDVKSFKDYFLNNCGVEKRYETYKVWSHWLTRNLCDNSTNYHIIPNPITSYNDYEIINHLTDKGCSPINAPKFYSRICDLVESLYRKYHQFKQDQITHISTGRHVGDFDIKYSKIISTSGTYHQYQYGSIAVKYNYLTHMKLSRLYCGPEHLRAFYLFETGFNYQILDGHSLQWSVPPNVLTFLQKFGVKTELFASPINTVLPGYYSLFVTDMQFGAIGNFYSLKHNQLPPGMYEVNPPFIDKIFTHSSDIILKQLQLAENKGYPLLFIYIMPDWQDCKGFEMLTSSPFLVEKKELLRDTHYYHQSNINRPVLASFNTIILIMANKMARSQWNNSIRDVLISLFSHKI